MTTTIGQPYIQATDQLLTDDMLATTTGITGVTWKDEGGRTGMIAVRTATTMVRGWGTKAYARKLAKRFQAPFTET